MRGKRRQDGAQVSGPSNGKEGAGKEREEHVWGWMGIENSALDLMGLRCPFNTLSRQLTYKPGVCRRNLGASGIEMIFEVRNMYYLPGTCTKAVDMNQNRLITYLLLLFSFCRCGN